VSLGSSRTRLNGALKELKVRWGEARARWDDVQSRDFEKQFLEPLEPKIRATLSAMEKMEGLLARVRRDCG
jgi:hypothetical protein